MTTPLGSNSTADETFPSRLKLPFAFDADVLAGEALAFDESEWIRHFNRAYYEGDWSGVPLRSPHGRLTIGPDPSGTAPWVETPYLVRCPAIRGVLAELACETRSVRLLRLGPGARILEHEDHNIGVDFGFVRLHIPVVTGPGVEFVLGGEPLHMAPGECWYVDVLNAHSVRNPGPGPRIHLVVDCIVDSGLLQLLRAARHNPVRAPMSVEGLWALRERVHADPGLALHLRGVEPERFAGEVRRLASELGCEVDDGDLARAAADGRRAWSLRWVR